MLLVMLIDLSSGLADKFVKCLHPLMDVFHLSIDDLNRLLRDRPHGGLDVSIVLVRFLQRKLAATRQTGILTYRPALL